MVKAAGGLQAHADLIAPETSFSDFAGRFRDPARCGDAKVMDLPLFRFFFILKRLAVIVKLRHLIGRQRMPRIGTVLIKLVDLFLKFFIILTLFGIQKIGQFELGRHLSMIGGDTEIVLGFLQIRTKLAFLHEHIGQKHR